MASVALPVLAVMVAVVRPGSSVCWPVMRAKPVVAAAMVLRVVRVAKVVQAVRVAARPPRVPLVMVARVLWAATPARARPAVMVRRGRTGPLPLIWSVSVVPAATVDPVGSAVRAAPVALRVASMRRRVRTPQAVTAVMVARPGLVVPVVWVKPVSRERIRLRRARTAVPAAMVVPAVPVVRQAPEVRVAAARPRAVMVVVVPEV